MNAHFNKSADFANTLNDELSKNKIKHEGELAEERKHRLTAEQHVHELESKIIFTPEFKEFSCQTEQNLDVPYLVTSPLPPIFSSNLCFNSKRLTLNKSLPNLSSIGWFGPDIEFTDEAEEALAEHYDRQVHDY